MINTYEKVKQANDLLKKDLEKSPKKKKEENCETWRFNFSDENKDKIQEAINNKNSSVTLELNYGEIRGDENLEIMLTKKNHESLEALFTITKVQISSIVKGLIAIFSVLAKPISLEELNNLINNLNLFFFWRIKKINQYTRYIYR